MLATALAAQGFNVVTIRSGSQYQYQSLSTQDSKVIIGSDQGINFVLNDDGSLGDTTTNKYLNIKDGQFVVGDSAQTGFSILDGHLVYNNEDNFLVCPSDNTVVFNAGCDGSLGIALRVINQSEVDEFKPTEPTTTAEAPKPTETASNDEIVAGKQFHLLAIHSGSQFQYVPIKKVDSHPHVFSVGGDEGDDLTVSFQDDKTSLVDSTGRGVNWDSNTGEVGNVAPFGRAPATQGFSISDGDLTLNGQQNWRACPSGPNKWSLATNDCVGGTGLALMVVYV